MSREKEDSNWTDGGLYCGIQKKKQLRHKVDTSKRERARRTRIRRRILS